MVGEYVGIFYRRKEMTSTHQQLVILTHHSVSTSFYATLAILHLQYDGDAEIPMLCARCLFTLSFMKYM